MKNSTKRVAVGAVVAAAAGYVAGVLTAPKSGKETRRDIKNATIRARLEAEKRLKMMLTELDKLLDQSKKGASRLKDKAAAEFANVVTQAQFAKQKAREILSTLHEGDVVDKDLKSAIKEIQQATDHLKKYLKKHPETQ